MNEYKHKDVKDGAESCMWSEGKKNNPYKLDMSGSRQMERYRWLHPCAIKRMHVTRHNKS